MARVCARLKPVEGQGAGARALQLLPCSGWLDAKHVYVVCIVWGVLGVPHRGSPRDGAEPGVEMLSSLVDRPRSGRASLFVSVRAETRQSTHVSSF